MRALTLAFVCLASPAVAQLTPEELKGIEEALYVGNMTLRDLDLPREPAPVPYRLPLVELTLAKPLEGANALMAMHASGGGSLAGNLAALSSRVFGDRIGEAKPLTRAADLGKGVPAAFRRPLGNLVAALQEANGSIKKALGGLSADERRTLLEALPAWAAEDSSLKIEFVTRPQPTPRQVEELVARVDLPAIRLAARRLAARLGSEVRALQALARTTPLQETLSLNVGGISIELSGQGNDQHTSRNAALCIDLGGNDVYTGRYGAGAGYASILIDLGGNDRYDVPDLSLGAGVTGIGLACDLGAGDDIYQARALAFGAGLAGVGALYDAGGRDSYRSGPLTQGFGALGIGALVDAAGDDSYAAGSWSQGAARTGGAGWLADGGGNEIYRGGREATQGYAEGHGGGALGGGVGLLSDLGGDDAYLGAERCQATARALSLGSLYDASGDDTYSARRDAQASADGGSGAALFDLAGNDAYTVQQGAAHAQGDADSVALLLDRAGDDLYVARTGRPGSSRMGGIAIFLDAAGSDAYPSRTVGESARGGGSVSLFADLTVSGVAVAPVIGGVVAGDGMRVAEYELGPVGRGQALVPLPGAPQPDSAPAPAGPAMESLYRRAAHGETEATSSLVAIGKPALEWMLVNGLAGAGPRELRVMATVARGLGTEGGTLLASRISGSDEAVAVRAIDLAVLSGAREAGPAIVAALTRPDLQRSAARAVGALRLGEAAPVLVTLAASPDRPLAREAFLALAVVGDETTVGAAQAHLSSPSVKERKAAIAFVARFPARGLAVARGLLTSRDEGKIRTGLEILQRMNTDEAVRMAVPFLTSEFPGARIGALLALEGRCPPESRPEFMALRRDPHPLVRSVALGMDPRR